MAVKTICMKEVVITNNRLCGYCYLEFDKGDPLNRLVTIVYIQL